MGHGDFTMLTFHTFHVATPGPWTPGPLRVAPAHENGPAHAGSVGEDADGPLAPWELDWIDLGGEG